MCLQELGFFYVPGAMGAYVKVTAKAFLSKTLSIFVVVFCCSVGDALAVGQHLSLQTTWSSLL